MPTDRECVAFLQWALPRLGLRWAGFRRVRRQVCRRLRRRLEALELADLRAYREYLDAHPEEWSALDALTPITISRFHRDRAVFADLGRAVLPALSAGRDVLRAWSAGCASGEEAYTVALVAAEVVDVPVEVLATDIDAAVLRRAREAVYEPSSLAELPAEWRESAFIRRGGRFLVRPELRRVVTVQEHDLRTPPPPGPFDVVLCRNVAFTYFGTDLQRTVLAHLAAALRVGGALAVGLHESLPEPAERFEPWPGVRAVYRRVS